MDIRKIKKLIELVEESGIAELEITEGEESVRIHRGPSGVAAPMNYSFAAPQAPSGLQAPASAPAAPEVPAEPAAPSGHVVKSPMVGTFIAPLPYSESIRRSWPERESAIRCVSLKP